MIQIKGPIPITIHFAFWITAGIIGFINSFSLIGTLIWIGIIFVSILVHEMGHALTAKAFGQRPRIEFIAFGGLTYPEGPRLPKWKEFIVVLDGPLFGFGLFLLSTLLLTVFTEGTLHTVFKIMQVVNLFWTIFNLIPVFPLDGGQLLRIVLESIFGSKGFRYALIVGMVFGFGAATAAFIIGFFLLGAFFMLFAFQSFEIYRRAKNMTEKDRDVAVISESEEIEKLLSENKKAQAIPLLEDLIRRTGSGIAFQRASEVLAQIRFEENNFEAVYGLLKPLKDDLSPPARFLLHKAAFEQGDFALVLEVGVDCFQQVQDPQVALYNAMAAAHQNQVTPSIGWLQSAQDCGLENLAAVVEDPAFDSIRTHTEFQKFIQDL
ncbi:MAG: site-2 protease family protein [Chlamydiales bacterium]|nr:site-2 protease family protein [Chlamydiales bacterium]